MSAGQIETRHEELAAESNSARVIVSTPEGISGTPVFAGTRVPVQAMIDYLKAGDTLDAWLDQFPSVSSDRAVAALDEMTREAIETARAHPVS